MAWVIDSIAQWLIIVILCFVTFGLLLQVGDLRRRLMPRDDQADLLPKALDPNRPASSGPSLNSPMPTFAAQSVNGFGPVGSSSLGTSVGTLLVFLTATCEGCQHLIGHLNDVMRKAPKDLRAIAIMQADEVTSGAFQSVFPLDIPLIADPSRRITRTFDVQHNPYALLYDPEKRLVAKGLVFEKEDIRAVLSSLEESGIAGVGM